MYTLSHLNLTTALKNIPNLQLRKLRCREVKQQTKMAEPGILTQIMLFPVNMLSLFTSFDPVSKSHYYGRKMFLTYIIPLKHHRNIKENCAGNSCMDPLLVVLITCSFTELCWIENRKFTLVTEVKGQRECREAEKGERKQGEAVWTWRTKKLMGHLSAAHMRSELALQGEPSFLESTTCIKCNNN